MVQHNGKPKERKKKEELIAGLIPKIKRLSSTGITDTPEKQK